jgi:hypothetical protein
VTKRPCCSVSILFVVILFFLYGAAAHIQGDQILEIKNRDTPQRYKIAPKITHTNEILFLFICLFILLRNDDVKG